MRKGIFTILIPVFNEEANMERLEEQIGDFVSKSPVPTEVLIVNDGSTDNSQKLIEGMALKNEWCNYITLAKNRGLSGALLAGISNVESEWIGYIDSDLQTHPDDFLKLLPFVNDYEMVTGIRAHRKDSFVKKLSSRLANQIRRWIINDGVSDTGCPLKIIRYHVAKATPHLKGMHRFWPAIVQMQGGKVKQVPVRHFPRVAGKAKYHLWNRLTGPLIDMFGYRWMRKRYIRYTIEKQN